MKMPHGRVSLGHFRFRLRSGPGLMRAENAHRRSLGCARDDSLCSATFQEDKIDRILADRDGAWIALHAHLADEHGNAEGEAGDDRG